MLASILLLCLQNAHAILSIGGTPAAIADFKALMEKCEGESEAFRELSEMANRHSGTITVNAGRNQPGVFVDGFTPGGVGPGAWPLDLTDLEHFPNPEPGETNGQFVFPEGVPNWASTRCQLLAHVLGEWLAFADTGNPSYEVNHNAGINWENRIRRDFGQQDDVEVSDPTNHGAPPPGSGHATEPHSGHIDGHSTIGSHQETWHISVPGLGVIDIEYHQ